MQPERLIKRQGQYFGDDDNELKHDKQSTDLPRELRGYFLSDRYKDQQAGVQVRTFSDTRIEKLHAQEREAETIQAWKMKKSNVYELLNFEAALDKPVKGYQCDWPPFIGKIGK